MKFPKFFQDFFMDFFTFFWKSNDRNKAMLSIALENLRVKTFLGTLCYMIGYCLDPPLKGRQFKALLKQRCQNVKKKIWVKIKECLYLVVHKIRELQIQFEEEDSCRNKKLYHFLPASSF